MKHLIKCIILAAGILAGGGCDLEEDDTPDFGQVRVKDESAGPVELFVGGESRISVEPGKSRSTRVGEGLEMLLIRNAAGKELFRQNVTIPDNTFAEYTVFPNEGVAATAGNIERPDIVGSSQRQVRLENTAAFPVRMFVQGSLVATVSPDQGVAVDAPDKAIVLSFRRQNDSVLFEQIITVPRNTTINYAVLPNGAVITTGGPIAPNRDFVPVNSGGGLFF